MEPHEQKRPDHPVGQGAVLGVTRSPTKMSSKKETQASLLSFLEIDDLRFLAWFLWMTPLETALSS